MAKLLPAPHGSFAESTSSSLLERARVQDRDAWDRLAHVYSPLIYHWCRQSGVAADDAPDLVQNTLLAVFRKVAAFRHDRPNDSFRAWLRKITRSKVIDHHRRRGVGRAVGGSAVQEMLGQIPDDSASSSGDAPLNEDTLLVRRSLELIRNEFEDRTWQAFWRIAVEGQRPTDVAAVLGMTLAAVYQAKSRVLKRLRRELQGLWP